MSASDDILARLEAENRALRLRAAKFEAPAVAPAPVHESVSRRQLLRRVGAGVGAVTLGAIAATAITSPVLADEGDAIHVGDDIGGALSVTRITNSKNSNVVFEAISEQVGSEPDSGDGTAIHGVSGSWVGVYGESSSAAGVRGRSEYTSGVEGYGRDAGVAGSGGVGVLGISAGNFGTGLAGYALVDGPGHVQGPEPPRKTGVYGFAGEDTASAGVRGASTRGRGGVFSGKRAQVQLKASTSSTHPSSGSTGDLFVDKNGRLWFCKGGSTWRQLA